MQERKSRLVNGAKQRQWAVTWNAQKVSVWAVTRKGAKTQAKSLFGVMKTINMTARPVKEVNR